MSGFIEQIQPINQLAEQADGFVWRYAETYTTREIGPPWDNPRLFFNMSVWRGLDSLQCFVRSPQHVAVMRNRAAWILSEPIPSLALWWIEETTRPTVVDAIQAITGIASDGDTHRAFSVNSAYASQKPSGYNRA